MRKTLIWITLVAVVVAGLVFAGVRSQEGAFQPGGSMIDPARPAPAVNLDRPDGTPFSLDELQGKVVLLFFGYTHCPDVCPTTLADVKYVFKQLGSRADDLRFVFVTVDPARDTPGQIASYLAAFDPAFIGLTGSEEALDRVYGDYNVSISLQPAAGVHGYEVEHMSRILVIDQEGLLVETLPYGLAREAILRDVEHLLR